MTAYATYADLEIALDAKIVMELSADAGMPMAGPNPVTDHALERASAIVRSYIKVGDIYTDDEIAILAAAHDPLLTALTVDLATEFLFQRRGARISPAIEQRLKSAYSYLEGLRDGKMLFGTVSGNIAAGTPAAKAVSLANLSWYNAASNSGFFPPRRGSVYP